MKKAILTIAVAAFAFAANAQLVIGGNLGINTNSGSSELITTAGGTTVTTTTTNPKVFDLNIMPKIGYMINDDMQVGLILGFGMNKVTTYDLDGLANTDDFTTVTANTITISPYFRYNITEMGNFKLFCEAAIPIAIMPTAKEHYDNGNGTTTDTDLQSGMSFGITVVPGLNYSLNDHISFDLYVNAIGLGFIHSTTHREASGSGWTTERNTVDNQFGFNVGLLPAAVTVGFNYAL